MHCIFQSFKINARFCILYSLADLNIGHCVELTFREGKLVIFLMLTFLLKCFWPERAPLCVKTPF